MATTGAVGGSQIDVLGLVSQLVAAERATPDKQIERESSRITTQISAVGQLMGSLSTFRAALSSLKGTDAFKTRSVTSSSEELLTASAGAKAAPGSYEIEVVRLAQAEQLSSSSFTGGGSTVIGTGSLTISLGANSFTVAITDDNSTLSGIRDAINNAADNTGVSANLVQGTEGARLVLTSTKTGAENTITIAQSGGDGGLAALAYDAGAPGGYTVVKAAQDALIRVAGIETTSTTNTVENVIDGLTLTLKKPTTEDTGPITLTVANDQAAVTKNVKSFVDAYNSLMAQIRKLRSYDQTTATAGPMLGDSLLNSIEAELRRTVSNTVAGQPAGFQSLSNIGVQVQLDGSLTLDDTKLKKALDSNFGAVGRLFNAEDGIAVRLFSQVDGQLKTGGAIENRNKNLVDQQRALTYRKDQLDARMEVVRQRYLAQFTRLDTLLSSLQVTSAYMAQQIDALPKINKD